MSYQLVNHHNPNSNAYIPFRLQASSCDKNAVVDKINEQLDRHDGVLDRYSRFDGLREDEDERPGEVIVSRSRFGRSRYDVALRFSPGEDQPISGVSLHRNRQKVLAYFRDENNEFHVSLHQPSDDQTYFIDGAIGGEAEVEVPFWPG
jgi:hypothetical protein